MSGSSYDRVKELFQQAVQHAVEDREAFVDQACGGDQMLRREVLSLLDCHSSQTLLPDQEDETRRDLPVAAEPPAGRPRILFPKRRGSQRSPIPPHPLRARIQDFVKGLPPGGQRALGGMLVGLFLLLVGTASTWVSGHAISQLRVNSLSKLLQANVESLGTWARLEKLQVEAGARDVEFRRLVERLVQQTEQPSGGRTREPEASESPPFVETHSPETSSTKTHSPETHSPETHSPAAETLQGELRREIQESFHADARYALWNRRYVTIADWSPDGTGIGQGVTDYGAALLNRVFRGETVLQMPGIRDPITKDYPVQRPQHLIGVLTPVRNERQEIIAAVLIYGLGAEQRFQDILDILRLGKSFESYAFDDRGIMISESRFNEQLKRVGLLPDTPGARSSLTVRLGDPGGDLTRGFRPRQDREALPLTLMARHAIAGRNGHDARGYRDYRGVWVVGAWQWLDDLGCGVAIEVDYGEAFKEFRLLRYESVALLGLLAVAVAALIVSSRATQRARNELKRQRRLGPYRLIRKLGQGGMGQVFLADHALLKRPTAVKLLRPEVISLKSQVRFEREVQLAARLAHPNTIEIYDYGKTEEGEFYCAMEYLTGITLDQLVRRAGPLPPGRCVYLLRQVCFSLREAHHAGLVHRDIKPQNIMCCARGGQYDLVKVLDFGLAKDLLAAPDDRLDTRLELIGTPLYMAPERLQDPARADARVDIYALGAVAYKLLTGCDLFVADTPASLLFMALEQQPVRPSERLGQALPAALEDLVLQCLARSPDHRPKDVESILQTLDALHCEPPWGEAEARAWWEAHPDLV